jgi:isoamylase
MKSIALFLNGETINDVDQGGDPIIDDSFLLVLNCHVEGVEITLPEVHGLTHWEVVFDTRRTQVEPGEAYAASESIILDRQTLMLLKARNGSE